MGDEGRCPRCGKEAREGASFCAACGAELWRDGVGKAAEGRIEGGKEAAPGAPSPLPPLPMAGTAGAAASRRRKRLALALGVAGGAFLAAGAVVLALYLTLWREGGGGVGDPVSLVRKYMRAVEEKDVDSYLDCFAEEGLSAQDNVLLENMGLNPRELLGMAFQLMEADFRDVALRLEHADAEWASVITISGTLVVSLFGLEERRDLGREPLRFDMKRADGRWYLMEDPLPNPAMPEFFHGPGDWGFDPEDLGLPDNWKEFPGEEDIEKLREWWREMQKWLEDEVPGEVPEDTAT